MIYLEVEDCVDHFKKREMRYSIFEGRANGDDAGYEDVPEIEQEDELEEDA